MTAKPLRLPVLLGPDLTRELADTLDNAAAEHVNAYFGRWCRESAFAVFVLLVDGLPARWHITGPMQQTEAESWLRNLARVAESQQSAPKVTH